MVDKRVVGVRFQKVGKLYHFVVDNSTEILPDDFAVVSTSRGMQIGQVVGFVEDPPKPTGGGWKKIERKATAADLVLRQALEQKELEATIACREKANQLGYSGFKVVGIEISFDSSTISILYGIEDQEVPDLKPFEELLSELFPEINQDFRRIGPRDVAKVFSGMGACGLEVRCCASFLTEFSPISIRMAKAQGVSLDPSEITGMCGRLRCCLVYEYEHYVEAMKELPKRGKRVITPKGEGKVVDVYPLRDIIVVRLDAEGQGQEEFQKNDLQPWDEVEALRRKAEEPSPRLQDIVDEQEIQPTEPPPSQPEQKQDKKDQPTQAKQERRRRPGRRRPGRKK